LGKAKTVIPDGLEPSFAGCEPAVVAAGPRDHRSVAEVGIEPTIDHHPLKVAALPVCVPGQKQEAGIRGQESVGSSLTPDSCLLTPELQAPVTIRTIQPYEGRSSTCPPAKSRPVAQSASRQGEIRTPMPVGRGVLSAVCLPVPPLGDVSSPYGNRTHLPSSRDWRPEPIDERAKLQCAGQELNLHSREGGWVTAT
jgi:hypothetical protein